MAIRVAFIDCKIHVYMYLQEQCDLFAGKCSGLVQVRRLLLNWAS
jgi:hypothetical protein